MNEKHKLYIVLGVICLFLIFVGGLIYINNKEQQEIYNGFIEILNSEENKLVYIGSSSCGFCSLLNPSIIDMQERYGFDYLYLETNEISNSTMSKILSDLGITSIGTPYLAIVSNGKLVASQTEYKDYDVTFEFLQANGIIDKDAKLLLNYIDLEQYKTLLKEDELNVIVVGQSRCQYCIQAKPILNNIVEEKNIDINYLNVSYFSTEEGKEFEQTLEYLQSDWGTPIMMITKNGKLIDIIEQLVSEEQYIEFLEENGVL